MSILHEFRDALVKELDEKEQSLITQLIKTEASSHDKFAGRIQSIQDIKRIINEAVKRWSTRDEEGD